MYMYDVWVNVSNRLHHRLPQTKVLALGVAVEARVTVVSGWLLSLLVRESMRYFHLFLARDETVFVQSWGAGNRSCWAGICGERRREWQGLCCSTLEKWCVKTVKAHRFRMIWVASCFDSIFSITTYYNHCEGITRSCLGYCPPLRSASESLSLLQNNMQRSGPRGRRCVVFEHQYDWTLLLLLLLYYYIHIYTHIITHTHTLIHTCMHACVHTHTHIYKWANALVPPTPFQGWRKKCADIEPLKKPSKRLGRNIVKHTYVYIYIYYIICIPFAKVEWW